MDSAVSSLCVCVWALNMSVCEVEHIYSTSCFKFDVCVCLDGSDSRDKPKLYRLQHSITEVGSDCTEDGAIQVTTAPKHTCCDGDADPPCREQRDKRIT